MAPSDVRPSDVSLSSDATPRPLAVVVMAAGMGTRMKSSIPKPLHKVAGLTILEHVLRAVSALDPAQILVVVGHGREAVVATLESFDSDERFWPNGTVRPVVQHEQLGTGHAVQTALDALDEPENYDVMVLAGDTPLLTSPLLRGMLDQHRHDGWAATVLGAVLDNPTGYGRLVEGAPKPGGRRHVLRIVEHRDATEEQREIQLVNTSIFCFDGEMLHATLSRLDRNNTQGELYLTDVVELLSNSGHVVGLAVTESAEEVAGVNDRAELAAANAAFRARINRQWMLAGVTMIDPAATYLDVDVQLAPDVTVWPGVVLTGRSTVGSGAQLPPGLVGHDLDISSPS